MKKTFFIFLMIISFSMINFQVSAQKQEVLEKCSNYIKPPFISYGQNFIATVEGNSPVIFKTTFYGGNLYRISSCCGVPDEAKLVFTLFDCEGNILFSNKIHGYSPYWDFKFDSTIECDIEVMLEETTQEKKYDVGLLIGFLKDIP